jgi:hypothetical protein
MSVRDYVLFAMTLLMGMFCGMYLYYTTFVPAYINNPVVQDVARNLEPEWTMGVRVYGGCERSSSCPAFSLDSKGRYRYQPEPNTAVENGRVPNELIADISTELTDRNLQQWSRVQNAINCASDVDGLDYRILVTTPDTRYDLNTCGTVLSGDGRLVALVRETLSYLDNPEQRGGSVGGAGVSGFLEQRLGEYFDYDDVEQP